LEAAGEKEAARRFRSHRLYHGWIVDPACDHVLDEVLFTYMKGPHSYTGEDVVEIQAHSGALVLRGILNLILREEVRLAEPGEFTKRAFLNGRIDLTQAEAVIDIIHAQSTKSVEISALQLAGNLGEIAKKIREEVLALQTELEAAIDFPEDVEETLGSRRIVDLLQEKVIGPMEVLIRNHVDGNFLREGISVVIVGRPNVGKSSVMNRLARRERSIVTDIPGTTRDLVEAFVNISGMSMIVTDTAGIQETMDPVEMIGVKKAEKRMQEADLILFILDAVASITDADLKVYEMIKDKKVILVINKIDLVKGAFELDMPQDLNKIPCIQVSALEDLGMDELRSVMTRSALERGGMIGENAVVPNLRQKRGLDRSLSGARAALEGFESEVPLELIAVDVQETVDGLNEVLGISVKDDVLGKIFRQFCIGK
jgi:tRNA modification GTPase